MDWLKRLWRAREGSVIVMGAMSLVSVLGMSGLAVEVGNAYAVKVQRQRVADIAALAGALAYKNNPTETVLLPTVQDVAQANGLKRSAVKGVVLSSDKSKVTVTIESSVPMVLTKVLGARPTIALSNVAVASLTTTTTSSAGCLMALSSAGTYGITLDQGPTTTATGCTIMTNSGVSVNGGPHLYASQVLAGKTILSGGIVTSPTGNNWKANQGTVATDPLANDAALTGAFNKLATISADQPKPFTVTPPAVLTAPNTPTGTDWTLDYNTTNPPAGVTKVNGNWVAATGGNYKIKSLNVAGGMTLTFAGSSTVTISNGVASVGNGVYFGNCTCKINGSLANNYQGLSFGNGSFQFGGPVSLTGNVTFGNGDLVVAGALTTAGTVTFGTGTHSVASLSLGGTLTFGAGDFVVAGPLTLTGGGTVNVGNGTTWIGATSAGVGLTLGGGSKLVLANGDLKVAGSVEISGGGTTLQMGTGSVYIGRSNAGVGFSDTNGTVTTGGGTYFSVLGPMVVGDGSTVSLGPADYRIGNSGSGNCTNLPNANCPSLTYTGSALTFGAGSLSLLGNFLMNNNGTLTTGAAATHWINGSMTFNGAGTLGAGLYLINGDFVRPGSSSGTLSGSNISLVLKGLWSNDGGSSLSMSAPADASGGGLAGILLATKASGTMTVANGNHTFSGVMYAPKADLRLQNTTVNVGNTCLAMVVNTYYQGTGGSANLKSCASLSGGSSTTGSIALVQ